MANNTQKAEIKVGQQVKFNGGFDGTITEIHAWADNKMFNVRADRGGACLCEADLD